MATSDVDDERRDGGGVDRLSMCHAIAVLVVGVAVAIVGLVETGSGVSWLRSPNSGAATALLVGSALYYAVDVVRLIWWPNPWTTVMMQRGLIAHHALCLIAVVPSVVVGRDAAIVVTGMVIGEVSNPPRLLAHRSKTCLDIHLATFVATRIAAAVFTKFAIPFMHMWTTAVGAIGVLLVSAAAIMQNCHQFTAPLITRDGIEANRS